QTLEDHGVRAQVRGIRRYGRFLPAFEPSNRERRNALDEELERQFRTRYAREHDVELQRARGLDDDLEDRGEREILGHQREVTGTIGLCTHPDVPSAGVDAAHAEARLLERDRWCRQ